MIEMGVRRNKRPHRLQMRDRVRFRNRVYFILYQPDDVAVLVKSRGPALFCVYTKVYKRCANIAIVMKPKITIKIIRFVRIINTRKCL